MKKTLITCTAVLFLAAPMLAGVVKKTKAEVTFRGFGKFSLVQSEKLTSDLKWTDTQSDFKGQGIAGGLAGKTILRSGNTGEIIDLPQSFLFNLDNKKKEYTVGPIKKIDEGMEGEKTEAGQETGTEDAESHIKITKTEFKVQDTGEESTINNFSVRKYLIHWLTEWEDTETGDKGSSRLETQVWTTPMNETLQKAQQEELKFYRAYMQKIGLNVEKSQEDLLGMRWLAILDSLGKGQPGRDYSKAAGEMQKIKGYPIVVDGQYFATGQKAAGESVEGGQEKEKDVKGTIGGLLKKTLKKKPADTAAGANEPALTYHTEVLEISTPDLGASDFQVPPGYKKK